MYAGFAGAKNRLLPPGDSLYGHINRYTPDYMSKFVQELKRRKVFRLAPPTWF